MFISKGFTYRKEDPKAFNKQQGSDCHREAVHTLIVDASSTFLCLATGWATLALSPQHCTRSDLRMSEGFGPGSSTAILSTAVSSTLGSSKPVSSTNKYLDFKVRLVSMHHF